MIMTLQQLNCGRLQWRWSEEEESCVWETRRSSLASLKAISICIMNGTSPFQLTNLWNCVLGDSSLATVSKLTGSEC